MKLSLCLKLWVHLGTEKEQWNRKTKVSFCIELKLSPTILTRSTWSLSMQGTVVQKCKIKQIEEGCNSLFQ